MPFLEIISSRALSPEMERLRAICFPGAETERSSRDPFDHRSIDPVIRIDGKVAAYGRLTPGPNAVFETWSGGRAQVPTGPDVIDLGRCLVAPEFRGLELITLLCLVGLLLARELGYRQVVGAVIPGRKLASMLYEIGFVNSGTVVEEHEPNGNCVSIQPLVASCNQADRWAELRDGLIERLQAQGFVVALFSREQREPEKQTVKS